MCQKLRPSLVISEFPFFCLCGYFYGFVFTRGTLTELLPPAKMTFSVQTHQWAASTCPLGYVTALTEQRSLHLPGNKINKRRHGDEYAGETWACKVKKEGRAVLFFSTTMRRAHFCLHVYSHVMSYSGLQKPTIKLIE